MAGAVLLVVCSVSAQGAQDFDAAFSLMMQGADARSWSDRSKRKYKLAYQKACRVKPKEFNHFL